MHAHLIQLDIAWEDKPANHARIDRLLSAAAPDAGDLILLPEMFDTGFSLNTERTADTDHRSASFLRSLASRTGCTVVASITVIPPTLTAPGSGAKARNRALAFAPSGDELASYDKAHPFTFGREGERFDGGDRLVTFPWAGASLRLCPAVCYDLRFPELFRRGLLMGAEGFVVVANWPAPRAAHWRALLIARAIENQALVLAVNRAGSDPHLAYAGGSIAIDPTGAVLAEADGREQVLRVPIDPEAVHAWRRTFPAWRDHKPWLLPPLPQ